MWHATNGEKVKAKPETDEKVLPQTTKRWQGLRVGWSQGDTIDKSMRHFLRYNK